MKKLKKILLIIFLILLLLFVGGTIALRIAFPPAKVKAMLLARMSETLHRQVEIGSISIGLRGLKVKGFKVSEEPSFDKGTFVQAGEFLVRPKLLPLLKKQISISEVTLISPKINITRRADGSFNFSDLMVKKVTETKKEEKVEKVEKRPPAKVKPMAFSFLVSRVSISGGEVKFVDRTPQKLSADLKNINLSVYGISLISPFFVEASFDGVKEKLEGSLAFKGSIDIKEEKIKIKEALANIGGAGIGATGNIERFMKPESLSFAVNIKDKGFALEKLSRTFAFPGDIRISGEPDINTDVSGSLKKIGIKGNVGLGKVEASFKDLFYKPSDMAGGMDFDILLEDNNILRVKSLSVALGGMKASASGNLAGLKKEMALNLKVALEKFDIKSLPGMVPIAKDYGLAGMAAGETEISGGPKSINISGKISVENIESIQKEIALKLDRSDLKYSGNVLNFKKPTVNFILDMGTVEVKMAEKPKAVKPAAKKPEQEPRALKEKPSPKIGIPPDATVSGDIKLKKFVFQNYKISDCSAKLDIAKSVLNLKLLSLSAYNGGMKGAFSTTLTDSTLETLKFSLDGDVKNIDIHQVIQATGVEPKGQFYAIASGNIKLSGSGKNFSKLNGSGVVEIKDVKITGIKIMDRIASAADIPELKETSFKSATGTLTIENGKVYLKNIKTDGGDKLDAFCSGNVNLVGKTQDIKGDIKFTKKYSGGDLAKYTGDAEGRVTVPFKIDGTFEDPKVNLDWGKLTKKAAEKAAEDLLKKEIEEGLKKLFKK